MAVEDRALGYVTRADAALAQPERAAEIWAETVRSTSDEMLVHRLPLRIDHAIRKVEGSFEHWNGLEPTVVVEIAETGPLKLFQLLCAHPNGRVREAFVACCRNQPDDRVLPHLANRAHDFVPPIRHQASQSLMDRLAAELSRRSESGTNGALPTTTHIALTKLIMPRTAVLDADLLRLCIELAETTTESRPGRLAEYEMERMLDRCRQTAASAADPEASRAVSELLDYFHANTIS